MPVVFSTLYEALRSANVPAELAEKASLVKGRDDKRNGTDAILDLIKIMAVLIIINNILMIINLFILINK